MRHLLLLSVAVIGIGVWAGEVFGGGATTKNCESGVYLGAQGIGMFECNDDGCFPQGTCMIHGAPTGSEETGATGSLDCWCSIGGRPIMVYAVGCGYEFTWTKTPTGFSYVLSGCSGPCDLGTCTQVTTVVPPHEGGGTRRTCKCQ